MRLVEPIADPATPAGYVAYALSAGNVPLRGKARALETRDDDLRVTVVLEGDDNLEPFAGWGPARSSVIYLPRDAVVDRALLDAPGKPAAREIKHQESELLHAMRYLGDTPDGQYKRYGFQAPHSVYTGEVRGFRRLGLRFGLLPGPSFRWSFSNEGRPSEILVPRDVEVPAEFLAPEAPPTP